ncbi:MAG: tRNA lysidine(34) synthetase TilS [Candidatus Omnitrophica bacterium]|nr:tRNA lysidine(34) synthetase TilS [Candidatus Omnitrophota bacterium]MBU4332981.1 tRNA lysidine(34) synthetase TilS [Candidatus Omnitrophota bacterium]
MTLTEKTKNYILSNKLLTPGEKVIIGVSGGPDSVTLTHILFKIQYDLDIRLHIAHYNHNLRTGSKTDQDFVRELAQKLNIPFSTDSWKNTSTAKKGSIEELARIQRLKFFNEVAKQQGAKTIVLAHTEDDQAETVLMRILRGSGLNGLRGMLPKRMLNGLTFIRPLLGSSRKEIEAYVKKNKLLFRTDPTNNQSIFYRNRIRINLLPLIEKQYSSNIKHLLSNLSKNISVDFDYLELQAKKAFKKYARISKNNNCIKFELDKLQKQHVSMKRMLLRFSIEHLKGNTNRLTLAHINEIEGLILKGPNNAIVNLPGNIIIQKCRKVLSIERGSRI